MKNIRHSLAALLLATGALYNNAVFAAEERIPENRIIYEVFVRNFSPEGNLKGVEAQIPRLKELGVDVVWLMPIYKLGEVGKWGPYSSPYAIKDYTAIDPDNGTEQDLKDLVKSIHDNGMEIWLDWVGNHTSMDNKWVSSNPEFYTRKDGEFVHPFGGAWRDVYELDRDSEAMQDEMVKSMQYWVDNFDIDGFRCDYAGGPSPELWKKTSEQVLKDGKRVAWLAEDSSYPSLVQKGYFDYDYCWDFQEKVLKDFANEPNLQKLRNACDMLANHGLTVGETKESLTPGINPFEGRSRMVYLSNHDVVQDQGGTEDILYHKYLRPLTALQFTVYGMPLIYNGQEIQYKSGGRVSVADKTPIDWSDPDESMTEFIKKLTWLKHNSKALRTGPQAGKLTNLSTNADDTVYAYMRHYAGETVVVVLNFSEEPKEIILPAEVPDGKYTDVMSGKIVDRNKKVIRVAPLDAAVLVAAETVRGHSNSLS